MEKGSLLLDVAEDVLDDIPEPILMSIIENQRLLDAYPPVKKIDNAYVARKLNEELDKHKEFLTKEQVRLFQGKVTKALKRKSENHMTEGLWETREKAIETIQIYLGKYFGFDPKKPPEKGHPQRGVIREKIINQNRKWKKLFFDLGLSSYVHCLENYSQNKDRNYFKDTSDMIYTCLGDFLEPCDLGFTWTTKNECKQNGLIIWGRHFEFDWQNLPQKESGEYLTIQNKIKATSGWRRVCPEIDMATRCVGGRGEKQGTKFYETLNDWVLDSLEYFLEDPEDMTLHYKKYSWKTKKEVVQNGKAVFEEYFGINWNNLPEKETEQWGVVRKKILAVSGWRDLTSGLGLHGGSDVIGSSEKHIFPNMNAWLLEIFNHFFIDGEQLTETREFSWENKKIAIDNGKKVLGASFGIDWGNLPKKESPGYKKIQGEILSVKNWGAKLREMKLYSISTKINKGIGEDRLFEKVKDWLYICLEYFIDSAEVFYASTLYEWDTKEKSIENGKRIFSQHFGLDWNNLPKKGSPEFQDIASEIKQTSWYRLLLSKNISTILSYTSEKGSTGHYTKLNDWLGDCLGYFVEDKTEFYDENIYKWETKEQCIKNGKDIFSEVLSIDIENSQIENSDEWKDKLRKISNVATWSVILQEKGAHSIGVRYKNVNKHPKEKRFFDNLQDYLAQVFDVPEYFFWSLGRTTIKRNLGKESPQGDLAPLLELSEEAINGYLDVWVLANLKRFEAEDQEFISKNMLKQIQLMKKDKEKDPFLNSHSLERVSEIGVMRLTWIRKETTPLIENWRKHGEQIESYNPYREKYSQAMQQVMQDSTDGERLLLKEYLRGNVDIEEPKIQELIEKVQTILKE